MLSYIEGDIFLSPTKVLVNTVNTVGVMGKGVAKVFKRIYPEMFREYQVKCESKELDIGKLWLYKTSNKWILNFPTKKDWRYPSEVEYIEKGLQDFRDRYLDWGIDSISFPPIGCGNGGLDFKEEVRPLIEKYLGDLDISILIYPEKEDQYEMEHMDIKKMKKWLRKEPASLPFTEVWNDIKDILKENDKFLTEFTKNEYEVVLTSNPKGIKIVTKGKSYQIFYDDLQILWNQLRQYGFSVRKIVPCGYDQQLSYLIPIFGKLKYIKLVTYSEDYINYLHSPSVGLQFVPHMVNAVNHTQINLDFFGE